MRKHAAIVAMAVLALAFAAPVLVRPCTAFPYWLPGYAHQQVDRLAHAQRR